MNQNSFSPKARWDRFEPGKYGFNPDALNERIEVLANFKHAKIFPKSFTWHSKEYVIETITYNWQERIGQALISYFSVLCAGQMYQISFDNSTFRWQIDKLIQ
ncbi:MAG: hypothetical protein KJ710_06300 [Candidatus Omnitrophica bacterium]|nr:hypothetical protein [Candidatus Omnitrophota bacterium]MBU1923846.1 hypothetical protein [Candidatus Omnitrophota bacterium]